MLVWQGYCKPVSRRGIDYGDVFYTALLLSEMITCHRIRSKPRSNGTSRLRGSGHLKHFRLNTPMLQLAYP